MKNLFTKYREIILYLVFGFATTFLCWGTYAVFVNPRICDLSVFTSNLLSWCCGVVFAFVTNKIFVFNSKTLKLSVLFKEITTFISARAITGVLEIVGVPFLEKIGFDNIFYSVAQKLNLSLGIFLTEGIYSKIAFSVVVVILNYIFSKLIVFKKMPDAEEK